MGLNDHIQEGSLIKKAITDPCNVQPKRTAKGRERNFYDVETLSPYSLSFLVLQTKKKKFSSVPKRGTLQLRL